MVAFLDINSIIDISSATYCVTLESLFLQGEIEVVREVHRKVYNGKKDGDERNGDADSWNSRWYCNRNIQGPILDAWPVS
jgi:hypothetical protein